MILWAQGELHSLAPMHGPHTMGPAGRNGLESEQSEGFVTVWRRAFGRRTYYWTFVKEGEADAVARQQALDVVLALGVMEQ